MKVKLIVAHDENCGIGKNNQLLWHLPNDMRFFKEQTKGHVVIMGRKNYDSIPEKYRPLPNRINVVLSRDPNYKAENCLTFTSLTEALSHFENSEQEVYIIGGGQIYKEALIRGVIDEMYITQVLYCYEADTYFPRLDLTNWKEETLFEHGKDEKHAQAFVVKRYYK